MWIDDDLLQRFAEPLALSVWRPKLNLVVMGSSNDPRTECDVAACTEDNVSILRRYGGGGTVLLYPGSLVVSVGTWVREPFQNAHYFRLLNRAVINVLETRYPTLRDLTTAGISDIAAGDRKIAGTSLFRSRNYLLYQASVLIHLDAPLISRYLCHPTKEPDYRSGRNHAEFLVGLADLVEGLSIAEAEQVLRTDLPAALGSILRDEMIQPQADQFKALEERLRRAKTEDG